MLPQGEDLLADDALVMSEARSQGQHQSAQIANLCGCGTSHVFDWLKMVREGGVEGLLQRDKPGPRAGFHLRDGDTRLPA